MPAPMTSVVRRLRTVTRMRWRHESRSSGTSEESMLGSHRSPPVVHRTPSNSTRFVAFQYAARSVLMRSSSRPVRGQFSGP